MKYDALNNGLMARGQYKVIVPASSTGAITPPTAKQGDAYTDGVFTANGTGVGAATRRIYRILCQGGGTVAIYDMNVVGNIATANEIWTKTVVAGDIYDFDCPMATGIYIVTGTGAQVSVVFD